MAGVSGGVGRRHNGKKMPDLAASAPLRAVFSGTRNRNGPFTGSVLGNPYVYNKWVQNLLIPQHAARQGFFVWSFLPGVLASCTTTAHIFKNQQARNGGLPYYMPDYRPAHHAQA